METRSPKAARRLLNEWLEKEKELGQLHLEFIDNGERLKVARQRKQRLSQSVDDPADMWDQLEKQLAAVTQPILRQQKASMKKRCKRRNRQLLRWGLTLTDKEKRMC